MSKLNGTEKVKNGPLILDLDPLSGAGFFVEFAKSNELAIVSEEPPIEATMSIHGLDMSNLCINYVCSGNPSAFKMIYSKMTREEFIQILAEKGYSYEIEGDKLVVTRGDEDGAVYLNSLTTLPPGVVFENKGRVSLNSLTSLPPDVEFKNGGSVDLVGLTTLSPGVVFKNNWYVNLRALTSLPPGVVFNNEEDVYLNSLTTLPPGVEFKNGGNVWLEALFGGWFNEWNGNIEGVDSKRLLNLMTSKALFER